MRIHPKTKCEFYPKCFINLVHGMVLPYQCTMRNICLSDITERVERCYEDDVSRRHCRFSFLLVVVSSVPYFDNVLFYTFASLMPFAVLMFSAFFIQAENIKRKPIVFRYYARHIHQHHTDADYTPSP